MSSDFSHVSLTQTISISFSDKTLFMLFLFVFVNSIVRNLIRLLNRFRLNIPIALTLMVRLLEKFIIVSPIMAPRPQNHPPFKSLYILVCIAILWVRCRPQRSTDCNKIKFGTKFSHDVNKTD